MHFAGLSIIPEKVKTMLTNSVEGEACGMQAGSIPDSRLSMLHREACLYAWITGQKGAKHGS